MEWGIFLLNKNKNVKTKIFLFAVIFILLSVIINLLILRVSINDIYLFLEKRSLKKEYSLVKKNISDENNLMNVMYDANSNGMKIKLYDSNYSTLYSLYNDKLSDRFDDLNEMLLSKIDNNDYKIITLKSYEKSGYDLHLVGKTENGYVIISSSISQLKKDAKVTTFIVIFTSIITLIIFLIISYYISKLLTKKINELKDVTSDITNLKFDKKLTVTANDEIGDLYNNINIMSDKLEKSITDLKEELKRKEKQEELRRQLIANISHEFKTPLTIISGYSQLMLSNEKDEENKNNLEVMISESDRLSELVHEFLELSKLESGNITLNKEEVNIKKIIESELKKLDVSIKEDKIKIDVNYNDYENIIVDKKQFTKVIENILTNAIKFAKYEKIIKIKTYKKDNYFYYEVFNTGDNIKDEDKENIFNSYYKNKSNRNKKGTGLGLTIVNAIVKLHDGTCIFENNKDGVKFIVKIKQ